jgi:ATP-dependent DNA helicase RecG
MKRTNIQAALSLRREDYFRDAHLRPALESGFIEMTISDKPRSSQQKYRQGAFM